MKNKKTLLFQLIVALIPILYLAVSWNHMPQRVRLHYNLRMQVDGYGTRQTILWLTLFLLALTGFLSVLVLQLPWLKDPTKAAIVDPTLKRISWFTTAVLTLVSMFAIYGAGK